MVGLVAIQLHIFAVAHRVEKPFQSGTGLELHVMYCTMNFHQGLAALVGHFNLVSVDMGSKGIRGKIMVFIAWVMQNQLVMMAALKFQMIGYKHLFTVCCANTDFDFNSLRTFTNGKTQAGK